MTWTAPAVAHLVTVLADTTPTTTPTGPEFGKASPIGLVVIIALLIGTALLIRSMNKHLRRLPATFQRDAPEPDQEADEGTERGVASTSDHAGENSAPDDSAPRQAPRNGGSRD
jgi:hypothetical protein